MKDILEEIVAHKREEVRRQKELLPPRRLHAMVEEAIESSPAPLNMSRSLDEDQYGIIAEFKRKSPSKGWIKEDGQPDVIPPAYARNGAAALSILTDSQYFGGSLDFLKKARPLVDKPILRKDFVVDEYQLFEARLAGADAVLLIAADLKLQEARALASMAHELGLEVLMELHSEDELDYASLDVDMVGVNSKEPVSSSASDGKVTKNPRHALRCQGILLNLPSENNTETQAISSLCCKANQFTKSNL